MTTISIAKVDTTIQHAGDNPIISRFDLNPEGTHLYLYDLNLSFTLTEKNKAELVVDKNLEFGSWIFKLLAIIAAALTGFGVASALSFGWGLLIAMMGNMIANYIPANELFDHAKDKFKSWWSTSSRANKAKHFLYLAFSAVSAIPPALLARQGEENLVDNVTLGWIALGASFVLSTSYGLFGFQHISAKFKNLLKESYGPVKVFIGFLLALAIALARSHGGAEFLKDQFEFKNVLGMYLTGFVVCLPEIVTFTYYITDCIQNLSHFFASKWGDKCKSIQYFGGNLPRLVATILIVLIAWQTFNATRALSVVAFKNAYSKMWENGVFNYILEKYMEYFSGLGDAVSLLPLTTGTAGFLTEMGKVAVYPFQKIGAGLYYGYEYVSQHKGYSLLPTTEPKPMTSYNFVIKEEKEEKEEEAEKKYELKIEQPYEKNAAKLIELKYFQKNLSYLDSLLSWF